MTVSVIVTTYNVEKYIHKCLQSLIEQSLKDMEIIVVDDGSTDKTTDIINTFVEKDKRLKTIYLSQNSIGGVGTAANEGIRAATGEYVGFADGDDWYENEMYELLYSAAKKNKADIAICNYLEYDEEKMALVKPCDFSIWRNDWLINNPLNGIERKKQLLKLISVPWRKLYKRAFLENNKIFFPVGDFFYEDNPFHWQCTTLAESFAVINKVLCYHRTKRKGQSMSASDNTLLAMYQHHETIHNWLVEKGLFETYKIDLMEWLINNTRWISRSISNKYKDVLFSDFQNAVLLSGTASAKKYKKKISVGFKGKMIYLAAIYNNKKMFFRFTEKQLGENLLIKMRRGYKEQGLKGLWLNMKRLFVYKIKKYIYQKRSAPKNDILKELSDIKTELRLIRAGQLFLYSEIKKLASSIGRKK